MGQYYLRETRLAPISKYELKMGWKIPAFLIDGMNSDLPGQVCAQVREDVYDSASGKYLLIPQGAKICGTYDSQIAVGQKRFLTVWNRIIFDDSSSLNLSGMPGADQAGYAGFDADVDNHYLRIYTSALMLSFVSAGVQISQPQQSSTNGPPTAAQTAAGALGQQLGQGPGWLCRI
jgi:type IV secretion system protein VirB10